MTPFKWTPPHRYPQGPQCTWRCSPTPTPWCECCFSGPKLCCLFFSSLGSWSQSSWFDWPFLSWGTFRKIGIHLLRSWRSSFCLACKFRSICSTLPTGTGFGPRALSTLRRARNPHFRCLGRLEVWLDFLLDCNSNDCSRISTVCPMIFAIKLGIRNSALFTPLLTDRSFWLSAWLVVSCSRCI